jgi:hypothetical protein
MLKSNNINAICKPCREGLQFRFPLPAKKRMQFRLFVLFQQAKIRDSRPKLDICGPPHSRDFRLQGEDLNGRVDTQECLKDGRPCSWAVAPNWPTVDYE